MGIGISVFLIAVGAVLAFAVDGTAGGVNFDAIGLILMIVGAVGCLVAIIATSGRTTDVVEEVHESRTHHPSGGHSH